jgi:hypothetical protein
MDLAIYIENIVRGFLRYNKYLLGTDLRNLSREMVRLKNAKRPLGRCFMLKMAIILSCVSLGYVAWTVSHIHDCKEPNFGGRENVSYFLG